MQQTNLFAFRNHDEYVGVSALTEECIQSLIHDNQHFHNFIEKLFEFNFLLKKTQYIVILKKSAAKNENLIDTVTKFDVKYQPKVIWCT